MVFALASAALIAVPGPAVLYIVTRSVHQGRRAGVAGALGIEVGALVHVAFAAVGLSAVIASPAVASALVKYVGAVYLIGVGLWALISHGAQADVRLGRDRRLRKILRRVSSSTSSTRKWRSSSSRSCRSSSIPTA